MSTFNRPTNLGPQRIERQEEVSSEPQETKERPSPEKVTPSQQGKFLSELEKKEKKKETKNISSEGGEEEKVEGQESGLFGLARKVKSRKSLGEKGSEESGTEEEAEQQASLSQAAKQSALQQNVSTQKSVEPTVTRVGSSRERIIGEALEKKERVAFRTSGGEDKKAPVQTAAIAPQAEVTVTPEYQQQSVGETSASREALIELFKQAVDSLTTMISKAETTTVVTIKYPPIFEGASLTLTEYSSAHKEYNIAFGNLSPDARRLLEATGTEERLRQALVDKGYTLHIMTVESRPLEVTQTRTEAGTPEGQRREQSFGDQEKKKKNDE